MKQDRQLAERIVALMNELRSLDADALQGLIDHRVRCNRELADHPAVPCGTRSDGAFTVGLLGILNGLCGVDHTGHGCIAARYAGDPKNLALIEFVLLPERSEQEPETKKTHLN